MSEEKKKFEKPEAEVISFQNDDIITISNGGDDPGYIKEGEPW
jgi:hypothetical protein